MLQRSCLYVNVALQMTRALLDLCPALRRRLVTTLAGAENPLIFIQDELHYLVLKDHVHGDVGRLHLGPKESRAKYDRHILHSHAIVLPILNDPA